METRTHHPIAPASCVRLARELLDAALHHPTDPCTSERALWFDRLSAALSACRLEIARGGVTLRARVTADLCLRLDVTMCALWSDATERSLHDAVVESDTPLARLVQHEWDHLCEIGRVAERGSFTYGVSRRSFEASRDKPRSQLRSPALRAPQLR